MNSATKKLQYYTLGKTNFLISEVGFGCYRVDIRSPFNREALKKALISGINLIDTSANYTDGNSELLVGDVVKELVNADVLSRESLVIVTKAGYLQGRNYELSLERKQQGNPFPDLIELHEGLEHCIHPEFLEDQITRSLERLEIETIDVYQLHNPEYYLKWAKINNISIHDARKEYYSRIKKAFEYLETEVDKGRIRHYGISSNTFPTASDNFEHTSLETILKIAEQVSQKNHFSVIQFPMNFAEIASPSLLELAKNNNIGILINRPLNAVHNNKLIKLAEPIVHNAPTIEQVNEELKVINALESAIAEKLKVHDDAEFVNQVENTLFVCDELQTNWLEAKNITNWDGVLKQYFLPRLRFCNNLIKKTSFKNEELEIDLYSCTYKIGRLFNLIKAYYNNEHLKIIAKIKETLANKIPELREIENLSNMAIRALRSTKGVSCVLAGMTQPQYVTSILSELKTPTPEEFDWTKINFDEIISP